LGDIDAPAIMEQLDLVTGAFGPREDLNDARPRAFEERLAFADSSATTHYVTNS
jgi:hypothetical protein